MGGCRTVGAGCVRWVGGRGGGAPTPAASARRQTQFSDGGCVDYSKVGIRADQYQMSNSAKV